MGSEMCIRDRYFGITLVGVHILRVLERKVHIPGYAVSGSM